MAAGVDDAIIAGAIAAGAAEAGGATAAAGGATAAGAGAASAGGATAAGSAGATGATTAGAASGATTAGTASAGATGTALGAESAEAGAMAGEGAKDAVASGASAVSGEGATSASEGGKKSFKKVADDVLDKYNQLHGGEADKWNDLTTWEKVGKTLNNISYDSSAINGVKNAMTVQPVQNTSVQPVQAPQVKPVSSDERLKDIEAKDLDPIDCFAQIDSYLYRYKPGVVDAYNGQEKGSPVNDEQNFGVMAQDLQANPLTRAAVEEDNNGYLMLDGGRLSSINTAMIAELCKKVKELEEYIYGR